VKSKPKICLVFGFPFYQKSIGNGFGSANGLPIGPVLPVSAASFESEHARDCWHASFRWHRAFLLYNFLLPHVFEEIEKGTVLFDTECLSAFHAIRRVCDQWNKNVHLSTREQPPVKLFLPEKDPLPSRPAGGVLNPYTKPKPSVRFGFSLWGFVFLR
jgi:hypothetical protein